MFYKNRTVDDDTVIETFADINGYPTALSPATYVIVRRNKKKRNKPYDYPQILYPNRYLPSTTTGNIGNAVTTTEYITNSPIQSHPPITSVTTTRETTTSQQQPSQQLAITPYHSIDSNRPAVPVSRPIQSTIINPPTSTQSFEITSYPYQQGSSTINWNRTGTNAVNQSIAYASDPTTDYIQRDYYYYPPRSNTIDRRFDQKNEPRVLHYYTGYDYFATLDPSDVGVTRHHPSSSSILGPPTRYTANSSYYPQNDYIKSTL